MFPFILSLKNYQYRICIKLNPIVIHKENNFDIESQGQIAFVMTWVCGKVGKVVWS